MVTRISKFVLLSLLCFISISLILASLRFGPRFTALLGHFTPAKYNWTYITQRPLVNVTMAAEKYKNPPQKPPVFTGTPKSLLEDTKRLVGHSAT